MRIQISVDKQLYNYKMVGGRKSERQVKIRISQKIMDQWQIQVVVTSLRISGIAVRGLFTSQFGKNLTAHQRNLTHTRVRGFFDEKKFNGMLEQEHWV